MSGLEIKPENWTPEQDDKTARNRQSIRFQLLGVVIILGMLLGVLCYACGYLDGRSEVTSNTS